MNKKDIQDLKQVLVRLDQQDTSRISQIAEVNTQLAELKIQNEKDHTELRKDIKTINAGLLHPQKGVWAHLNLNTTFRTTLSRALWYIIPIIGAGAVGSFFDLFSFVKAATTGTGP